MSALNDAFQARLERTGSEQDWPYLSMLAHELGDAYAELTEQVETLTADNAALLDELDVAASWLESRPDYTEGDAATSSSIRVLLKTAHSGAALLEEMAGLRARVERLEGVERAYEDTSRRLGDARTYCQKHLMPGVWGRNVWHAILDDAIALRAAQEGGR